MNQQFSNEIGESNSTAHQPVGVDDIVDQKLKLKEKPHEKMNCPGCFKPISRIVYENRETEPHKSNWEKLNRQSITSQCPKVTLVESTTRIIKTRSTLQARARSAPLTQLTTKIPKRMIARHRMSLISLKHIL